MVNVNKVIVAVPVKDEVDRIGAFISAIAGQTRPPDILLLLLNNCTDGTLAACQASHCAIKLELIQYTLPPPLASAGEARRLALAHALPLGGDGAIVLTTDADALPDPQWITRNLNAIANGAEIVCGQAALLPEDKLLLPARMLQDDRLEAELLDLLDEIDALVDPDPFDPWPRHQHHSGASIAMQARMLRLVGGAPHVSTAEDRALVVSFRNIDARIRHDPTIIVPVSGRLEGRAENGMAATLKRRMKLRDEWTDERVEPAIDGYRRSLAKARLRAARAQNNTESIAADLLIGEPLIREALNAPYFGIAWEMVQQASPVLHRRRVAYAQIGREIRQATQLRDLLAQNANRNTVHVKFAVG